MFLLLCGICCVLILPVFAVGMAVLQDKLPMLSRRSPGLAWRGWGRGGKMFVVMHSPGPPPPPGLFRACLPAKVLDPETPSCELAGGEGRRELCLPALSSDEGEACVGQTSGSRCWWRTCQDRVEGKAGMHMLLDTGGLGEP